VCPGTGSVLRILPTTVSTARCSGAADGVKRRRRDARQRDAVSERTGAPRLTPVSGCSLAARQRYMKAAVSRSRGRTCCRCVRAAEFPGHTRGVVSASQGAVTVGGNTVPEERGCTYVAHDCLTAGPDQTAASVVNYGDAAPGRHAALLHAVALTCAGE
jgi:hypothetical protein